MTLQAKDSTSTSGFEPIWIGADVVTETSFTDAIAALEEALSGTFSPEQDGTRTRHNTPSGQLLQMPSSTNQWCGTKLITIRDSAEPLHLPSIQGLYALFEGESLRPVAVLEGAALTTLRTPAVTALAIKYLVDEKSGHVALFGTGVQAQAHVDALLTVYEPRSIAVVGRTSERVAELIDYINSKDIEAYSADPDVVSKVDVVMCCTASDEPLFDGNLLQNHAVVAAMGSHTQEAREVDTATVTRSLVVIESQASARAEAGDLFIPNSTGNFEWERAITLQELVKQKETINFSRPRLFKGTGMPWQDLAVAARIYTDTQS